jgi:hypothetical protein
VSLPVLAPRGSACPRALCHPSRSIRAATVLEEAFAVDGDLAWARQNWLQRCPKTAERLAYERNEKGWRLDRVWVRKRASLRVGPPDIYAASMAELHPMLPLKLPIVGADRVGMETKPLCQFSCA